MCAAGHRIAWVYDAPSRLPSPAAFATLVVAPTTLLAPSPPQPPLGAYRRLPRDLQLPQLLRPDERPQVVGVHLGLELRVRLVKQLCMGRA